MLIFLKLGGSLITDKSTSETARLDAIQRIAAEIKRALHNRTDLSLLVGHGSGSFGHIAASQYATHQGVRTADEWYGFAEVAATAARLNQIVFDALYQAGIPVLRIQPSASALCEGGTMVTMAAEPVQRALDAGLVPLVYGDVAFDRIQGGAIISTEQVFSYLAETMLPKRMLLAGDYEGVLDRRGHVIRYVRRSTLLDLETVLQGSSHADVTGGMASKVASMVDLCERVPGLSVSIFSGDEPGMIERSLVTDSYTPGTSITA